MILFQDVLCGSGRGSGRLRSGLRFVSFFPHDQQADQVDECGQDPADGVADVQGGGGAEQLEDGGDPDQTQQAAAHQTDHHRQDGITPSAQAAGQHIHRAAEQIGGGNDVQACQPCSDNGLVRGVEVEQRGTGQSCTAAQHKAGDDGTEQAVAHDPVEVVVPACAHVLTGKGDGRLRKGVHGRVDKALDVGGRRISGHDGRAKGIDRRLDDHIGQAEHRALQTGRQTDAQDLQQSPFVEAQMPQVEVERAFFTGQDPCDKAGRNGLADDGRQCDTGHAELEADDKDEVEHYIDDAGCGQTVERAFGVAHRAQKGRAEVVQHGHRHPDEIDLQVEGGKVNDILRAGHQLQKPPCGKKADKGQQHAADETQRDRGLDGVADACIVFCAETACRHDVCTQRHSDEQVDQQVDQRTVGADRGQCSAARKPADHHNVGCVEEELQDAGRRQRQRKQDDFLKHRAACQVAGHRGSRHVDSASFENIHTDFPIIFRNKSPQCQKARGSYLL